mmetsp:Transcript_27451/g.88627  ORF Transcript_27451/g.88627 Transcript_27451/m.88627 type:complete len:220 (+) Transcript_27451:1456-2115(+)
MGRIPPCCSRPPCPRPSQPVPSILPFRLLSCSLAPAEPHQTPPPSCTFALSTLHRSCRPLKAQPPQPARSAVVRRRGRTSCRGARVYLEPSPTWLANVAPGLRSYRGRRSTTERWAAEASGACSRPRVSATSRALRNWERVRPAPVGEAPSSSLLSGNSASRRYSRTRRWSITPRAGTSCSSRKSSSSHCRQERLGVWSRLSRARWRFVTPGVRHSAAG